MSSPQHLQAIPPALYFLVPLAAILFFCLTVSRTSPHRHDPILINIRVLDSRKRRVLWVFPVVFSLALLSIAAGALLFLRQRSNAFSLAIADAVVTSVLYMELSLSVMYLLSVVTTLATLRPIMFFFYCILLAIILISATLVSIAASFRAMPPLLSTILRLSQTVLTLPVITFSLLSTLDASEVALAPQITLSPTYSYPRDSLEKPSLDDIYSTLEISPSRLPARAAPARNISLHILCGQIAAIVHFAFAIAMVVLLPDQSSPPPTLMSEEIAAGVWEEALIFQILQTVFLVLWIICTMSAFLRLYTRSVDTRASARTSTTGSMSEATMTAFTDMPQRGAHRTGLKRISASRSSSFSSPRPRRKPVISQLPPVPRRPSPDDFQNLHDPFAPPAYPNRNSNATGSTAVDENPRPTRMSAWGTLPPVIPPRPPPNVLMLSPSPHTHVRALPSLRRLRLTTNRPPSIPSSVDDSGTAVSGPPRTGLGLSHGPALGKRTSISMFSYTSPSAYSQDGEGDDGFDMDEALIAQQLLQRLDAAAGPGWGGGRSKGQHGHGKSGSSVAGGSAPRRWPRR